jgi:hypothetical protein
MLGGEGKTFKMCDWWSTEPAISNFPDENLTTECMLYTRIAIPRFSNFISLTYKRTERRAPVWGSEFTSKDAALQGGIQQKPLLG